METLSVTSIIITFLKFISNPFFCIFVCISGIILLFISLKEKDKNNISIFLLIISIFMIIYSIFWFIIHFIYINNASQFFKGWNL